MYYIIFLINLYLCLPCDSRIIPSGRREELIIGGKSATKDQFPYAIALYFNRYFQCTGTIISRKFVLTAAHCVVRGYQDFRLLDVTLFHGIPNYNRNAEVEKVRFDKIIRDPGYGNFISYAINDVAVMRTTSPIDIDENISPIRLAGPNYPLPDGRKIALGWGQTEERNPSNPVILQYTGYEIIDKSKCNVTNDKTRMCGQGSPKDSHICFGDSGGPLVYQDNNRPVQIGITSYGPRGCRGFIVFANVSAYNPFIKEAANDDSICYV